MVDITKQAAQPVGEGVKNAVDAANPLLDIFSKVPVEIWVVVATATVGAMGWFGKTAFDTWRKSRLPFKQDKERYQAVMAAVDPANLHYLKETPLSSIGNRAVNGIDDAYDAISSLRKNLPSYLHQKLAPKENELFVALGELCEFLPMRLYPHRMNGNIFTMYWDQFDEWNNEDQARFSVIKNELTKKLDRSIAAYDAYRDTGNKLFADRLVKGESDG